MRVLIDSASGCCNGVGRAISAAERYLQEHDTLYSLGAIVHNDAEIRRLAGLGLKTIGYQDLDSLKGSTVLIRAHGEPPSTYRLAEQSGVSLIDCTCPVVLALQRKIAAKYSELSVLGGQVIIFGKRGHAEVNGLVGQTDGQAVVVESIADLKDKLSAGVIDPSHPLALFSQTTKDPDEFASLAARLRKAVFTASSEVSSRDLAGTVCTGDAGSAPLSLTDNDGCRCVCSDEKKPVPDVAGLSGLEVFDTVCRNVSSRHKALREFAASCSVIIFVCGRESSNGKVLFELCRSVNPRSYKVESADEIPAGIFREDDVVGICGATSTTRWQLEKAASAISGLSVSDT